MVPTDSWFPVGFSFPDNVKAKHAIFDGGDWQIYESDPKGRILVVKEVLAQRWLQSALLEHGALAQFQYGADVYFSLKSSPDFVLEPLSEAKSPDSKSEALAFAKSFRATRSLDKNAPLQDSIYVEKYSRLLPTYSISNAVDDDVVLGYWLTGGVLVSVNSTRRFRSLTSWLGAENVRDVVAKSGIKTVSISGENKENRNSEKASFSLSGRTYLENFLKEHVIDIVENQERYKALGIGFPSAIVLYGPPGCGKTYAIERLVEYLDWPSYQIEASSVASPYIHETSKKVAAIFEQAMENAPSIIVIDEMEAFLTNRQASVGHHHVEEVAEFLRRIPEAVKNNVLVVGMTNQIDMIDPAILRRGRFDHIIKVDMASEEEVLELLKKLIAPLPNEGEIELFHLAEQLCGRPLSDVSFVVREGARLAARTGKNKLDQESLDAALEATASRHEDDQPKKIGFVV